MPFAQKIGHFLSHVAFTSNKAKVLGNLGPSENWRWTSVGIADTRRKFEWWEFCITLKVVCYFLLYCSYTGSKDKLGKNSRHNKQPKNPWKFICSFQSFCINPMGNLWNTQEEWKYKNETVFKMPLFYDVYIFISHRNTLFIQNNRWGIKTGRVRKWQKAFTLIKHLSRSRLLLWLIDNTDAVDQTDGWYQRRRRKE